MFKFHPVSRTCVKAILPKLLLIGFRGMAIVIESDQRDGETTYQLGWQKHALDRYEWQKEGEAFGQQ